MFLIKNGKTNYSIYLAEQNYYFNIAAKELNYFIKLSTGCEFGVTYDNSPNNKIVLKVESYENLKDNGYKIYVQNGNIYLTSKTHRGVLNGVYGLLNKLIAFEPYARDEIYYECKNDIEINFKEFFSVPDIDYRDILFYNIKNPNAYNKDNSMTVYRFRNTYENFELANKEGFTDYNVEQWYGVFRKLFCHTTFMLLPPEKDENGDLVHKDWYNEEVNQLCWTNEEGTKALIESLKNYIYTNQNGKIYCVGIEDNSSFCQCPKCMEEYKKYGISGAHVRFINKVAKAIEAWRKETLPDQKFLIGAFAYLRVKEPPIKFNEITGNFEPIDSSVIFEDNVILLNAPIDRCGYHSLNCDCNRFIKERLINWNMLVKQSFIWDYHAYFDNYMIYQPGIRNFAENIKMYKQTGTQYLFSEGHSYGYSTGFHDLRAYVLSKLAWDCTLDTNTLINDFFEKYYKIASKNMMKYFNNLEKHYSKLESFYQKQGPRGYHISYDIVGQPDAKTEIHWPKKFLENSKEILNNALIDCDKELDAVLRDTLKLRVKSELVMIEYLLIELYTYFDSKEDFERKIEDFIKLTKECNIERFTHWKRGRTIQDVINMWRCRYPARSLEKNNDEKNYDKR